MVAVKKIANAFDNHMDAKRTLREIKLLRHLDHENVSFLLSVLVNMLAVDFSIRCSRSKFCSSLNYKESM